MSRAVRTLQSILPGVLLGAALAAAGAEIKFDYSRFGGGQLPPGFASLVTGKGKPGDWKILDEIVAPTLTPLLTNNAYAATAKHTVLAQTSQDDTADHAPLLLYTNETLANFTMTTRLKIVSGAVAPEAGIVFRAQDASNYYVVRASAMGNLLWYRVVGGVRYEGQGIGVKVPIARDSWQELSVQCTGNQFRCFLNGKLMIPPARPGAPTNELAINDNTFATGQVGLWTAADTTAYFADTQITYTPRVPLIQTAVKDVVKRYPRLLGLEVYALKNSTAPVLIADGKGKALGTPGGKPETDVIGNGATLYLKLKDSVELTMPLRDRNGDVIAAVKIAMTTFRGETTDSAVDRATVVKQALEKRLNTLQDINE